MAHSDYFLNLLHLNPDRHSVIAVVGGGGKTSLIYRLAEEYLELKKRVIITTTTHMEYDPGMPLALDGDLKKVEELIRTNGYAVAAGLDKKSGKICGLKKEVLEILKDRCDVMLVEADGSRHKPIKVPADWEPAIPDIADVVISVVGLDCLGKPICETAHRVDLIADFLHKNLHAPITQDDVVKVASSIQGLFKNVNDRVYRVYLNKADVLKNQNTAGEIVKDLQKKGKQAAFGSLKTGDGS